jgi:hypothetical protein
VQQLEAAVGAAAALAIQPQVVVQGVEVLPFLDLVHLGPVAKAIVAVLDLGLVFSALAVAVDLAPLVQTDQVQTVEMVVLEQHQALPDLV